VRIGVISDIHGNCTALDAVLGELRRDSIESIVCLGDAVQGGPQPVETVARLREIGCPVVMGNADAWLLTGVETSQVEQVSPQQQAVREWQLAQLADADRAFIAAFPPTSTLLLDDGRSLLCFHGSPQSFDDLIFPETPEDELFRMCDGHDGAVLCGGHTHLQQIRRLGDAFFFNPGSVGLAYNRHQPENAPFRADPWAEYAVLTSEDARLHLEFRRVPFDVAAFLGAARASGRPHVEAILAEYGAA
jgi:predicted phosphodiesterase